MTTATAQKQLEERMLRPLTHTSRAWFLWLAFLLVVLGTGMWAYSLQLRDGLAVTGMRDTVIWGLYIADFVFFSGVSMAGTFISAILRMTGAQWRQPLTRLAELTTVSALIVTAMLPVVDIGRPERMINLIRYGRLESPLIWDILVIPTYLTASAIYLYLFLIPDSAILRDRLKGKVSGVRMKLYSFLAMGWQGAAQQHRRLNRGGVIMMLLVIPIGVATHSVVSWIFGMTFRAGWNSTIMAPYFAVGALYSGTAMLITLMIIFRKTYRLEAYFTEQHFRYLSYLMAAFGMVYLYFTFAEYLTVTYKLEGGEKLLLQNLLTGRYAPLVWGGFLLGQILPMSVVFPKVRGALPVLLGLAIFVNIGMWIKRYVIVVPSLANPQMPYEWGFYSPTWVELAITGAAFAGFALLITLFTKLFPIVSIWEMEESFETKTAEAPHASAKPARGPAIVGVSGGSGENSHES